jgi:CheY-like chemotaxis protein
MQSPRAVSRTTFSATLSHELRTPLNAILGYSRMLRSGVVDRDRQARALEIVERNATALSRMVADVLDVSRIVAGKMRLNVQLIDLPMVVEEAIATIRPAADAKGVRLQTVMDTEAGPVLGDGDRLQQVIWNLVSNAVRFTPRDGLVQVRMLWIDSHVEIVISDTGAGIASEFLPHVFERFRQADSRLSREHGGLGLGLAISRELIELHGGTIRCASDGLGKGATFFVKLPRSVPSPATGFDMTNQRWSVKPREPATTDMDLKGLHVLVVDDDPDALTMMREILEAAGATVISADSGRAALTALDERTPDAIVSDLGMPGMDGFELLASCAVGERIPEKHSRGRPHRLCALRRSGPLPQERLSDTPFQADRSGRARGNCRWPSRSPGRYHAELELSHKPAKHRGRRGAWLARRDDENTGVFEGGATQPGRMHRRPNAGAFMR